jgi:hypothetical protein
LGIQSEQRGEATSLSEATDSSACVFPVASLRRFKIPIYASGPPLLLPRTLLDLPTCQCESEPASREISGQHPGRASVLASCGIADILRLAGTLALPIGCSDKKGLLLGQSLLGATFNSPPKCVINQLIRGAVLLLPLIFSEIFSWRYPSAYTAKPLCGPNRYPAAISGARTAKSHS